MSKVLLFGGSFDPVHLGHLIVCRHVAGVLGAARTVLVPSASPPHKLGIRLSPAADRLEMCRLATRDDPDFEVSDWEIGQAGPNYTLLTVRHFREILPADTELYWLIGMDSLIELPTWYHVDELASACTLVTAGRPGFARPNLSHLRAWMSPANIDRIERHVLETPLVNISATEVRERARTGQPIADMVPDEVAAYISAKRLYGAPK